MIDVLKKRDVYLKNIAKAIFGNDWAVADMVFMALHIQNGRFRVFSLSFSSGMIICN